MAKYSKLKAFTVASLHMYSFTSHNLLMNLIRTFRVFLKPWNFTSFTVFDKFNKFSLCCFSSNPERCVSTQHHENLMLVSYLSNLIGFANTTSQTEKCLSSDNCFLAFVQILCGCVCVNMHIKENQIQSNEIFVGVFSLLLLISWKR